MTNPTPHGQVPEALIDLIDAYAETRHRCGSIYNAKTEAARKAVIEALSGVQALSAAPANPLTISPLEEQQMFDDWCPYRGNPDPRTVWAAAIEAVNGMQLCAALHTPAEQQAAPKAAPGEPIKRSAWAWLPVEPSTAMLIAGNHGQPGDFSALKVWQDMIAALDRSADYTRPLDPPTEAAPQQEAQEPVAWLNPWRADQVTTDYDAYGERGIPLYTAPQPAPDCHHRPPCDECAAPAAQGGKA